VIKIKIFPRKSKNNKICENCAFLEKKSKDFKVVDEPNKVAIICTIKNEVPKKKYCRHFKNKVELIKTEKRLKYYTLQRERIYSAISLVLSGIAIAISIFAFIFS